MVECVVLVMQSRGFDCRPFAGTCQITNYSPSARVRTFVSCQSSSNKKVNNYLEPENGGATEKSCHYWCIPQWQQAYAWRIYYYDL